MNKINSNFSGQTIFVGMDIHKSSWNLGIHLGDMFVKNVHQKPSPSIMASYLKQHFPSANYKAAYEAGKFGFWIQRQLTALGIECLVVNPADIPFYWRKNDAWLWHCLLVPFIPLKNF